MHWGLSSDIELYLQETGRAGRDGNAAQAILHLASDPGTRHADAGMKEYCQNKSTCRREVHVHVLRRILNLMMQTEGPQAVVNAVIFVKVNINVYCVLGNSCKILFSASFLPHIWCQIPVL